MSALARLPTLANAEAVPLAAVPAQPWEEFETAVTGGVAEGSRVVAYFGEITAPERAVDLYALLAEDRSARIAVARTSVEGETFPSLAPRCPQVQHFEREIAEQLGLRPEGHPAPAPVRFHPSYRTGHDAGARATDAELRAAASRLFRVEGDEVHEVGVGPVHAGVIEPGHFRFQCHGEEVFHLEISLGYQHRGIERALVGGPDQRTIHYLETAAGDSSVGHATAYCQAVEALAGRQPTPRAEAIRGIALELERVASHVGDLGALAGDVGFLPTASYCGRLRGDFLNLTAELCGSRFGRGLIRPGGVAFDVEPAAVPALVDRLERAGADTRQAVELLWDTPSVMARFEGTGALPREVASELGLTGPAARACGLERDARSDHPAGIFRSRRVPIAVAASGDVFARAWVRWLEIQRSIDFLRQELAALGGERPALGRTADLGPRPGDLSASLAPHHLAVALVEGWRGEICHVALTDERGRFARYKIVDPSFHNWSGLAYAMRGQQISDFPLCNKSFNLSYCGHDL